MVLSITRPEWIVIPLWKDGPVWQPIDGHLARNATTCCWSTARPGYWSKTCKVQMHHMHQSVHLSW